MKMKKTDLIFIAALLALAGILFLANAGREEGAFAVVTVNGEAAGKYPLDEDGIFPLNGGSNTLVIEAGEAFLTDADCPDKLCVKMGRISKTGQSITCLPNRLIVKIEGAGKAEFDALSG